MIVAWLLLLVNAASPLAAQDPSAAGRPRTAAWMSGWSPFAVPGDLPRLAPAAAVPFPGLLASVPRIGLAWTAGNPAALADEARDARSEFLLEQSRTIGDYRRPYDPTDALVRTATATAWRRLSAAKAVAGRVIVESQELDPSSVNFHPQPYSSSPFAVTDTTRPAYRRMRARLEGASGWRIGRLGLGLAVGYEAADSRTVGEPLARFSRATDQAVAGGVTYDVGGVRLGAIMRWLGHRSDLTINPVSKAGLLHLVYGYQEPTSVPIVDRAYMRRTSERRLAGGVAAAGRIARIEWVIHASTGWLELGHWTLREDDPPRDEWTTSTRLLGAAVQTSMFAERLLATFALDWTGLQGEATLENENSAFFLASERRLVGTAELRWAQPASAWAALMTAHVRFDGRDRRDTVEEIGSSIETLTATFDFEVARSFGERLLLAAGIALASHRARGSLVDPAQLGSEYRRLIAPELALHGTPVAPTGLHASSRWQASESLALWLGARYQTVGRDAQDATLPPPSLGDRSTLAFSLGAVLADLAR